MGGAVVGGHVHACQKGGGHGPGRQALIEGRALGGVHGEEGVQQHGRLPPGQQVVPVGGDALQQAQLLRPGQVVLRPEGADVGIGVPQQTEGDGGRLGHRDAVVRAEGAVAVPRHQALGVGQVHIGRVPAAGGHVGEQGLVGRGGHAVPVALRQDNQLAELGPGQPAVRVVGAGAVAGDNAQPGEDLHRPGRLRVGHVGKGRRGGGRQPGAQKRGQHSRQKSFLHGNVLLSHAPPHSARRASTGWRLEALAAG